MRMLLYHANQHPDRAGHSILIEQSNPATLLA